MKLNSGLYWQNMQLIAIQNTFNNRLFSHFPIPEYIDIDYNFLNGSGRPAR